jgi:hypothetical protein
MNVDVFLAVTGIAALVVFVLDAKRKRRDFLHHRRDVTH